MRTFKQFIAEQQELSLEDFSVEELQEFMQSEEYEQLDELSKGTLASYIPKAAASMSSIDRDVESLRDKKAKSSVINKRQDKSANRAFNISLAAQKLARESEQLDEANFASCMKSAIAAHERGDAKRAAYHLDNARTARYAMKSTEVSKHKDLLDKYKDMRDQYKTGSQD